MASSQNTSKRKIEIPATSPIMTTQCFPIQVWEDKQTLAKGERMTLSKGEKERQSAFQLSHKERYTLFIKEVIHTELAWGLFSETGWCLAQGDNDARALALWPRADYAQACAEGTWKDAIPQEIPLPTLLNELLPTLAQDNMVVVVFPAIEGDGIVATPKELYQQIKKTQLANK